MHTHHRQHGSANQFYGELSPKAAITTILFVLGWIRAETQTTKLDKAIRVLEAIQKLTDTGI